ncbi:MAG: hypothetical protein E6K81_10300 [Candidatus Eisenbacteria bacterium]|uniref:Outer membrane protein beta-barrel domain-containing protein n=1 Tax=Eiseniibacteriota bacterium TaxID=2212470 RepID=A0A538U603_UNCEI|nr:MAG: hypothetical protein E6K81_10300 [Candidatus Eisenbacteria bacterium]
MCKRFRRLPAVLLLALLAALVVRVPSAGAAAEFHKFNVVLSAIPTQLRATDFNRVIDVTNAQLQNNGLAPIDRIHSSWYLDAEVRYFVRQNLALSLGGGRIRKSVSQEYLPAIAQSIVVSANITSVPLYAGGAYYFKPYNQGDFQARAYVGAGFMSVVYNRASLAVTASGITLPPEATRGLHATNDAPGYYAEAGAHLFFATRFSVLLSGLYRSNEVHNLVDERSPGTVVRDPRGQPLTLDLGGLGFRMALGIGM